MRLVFHVLDVTVRVFDSYIRKYVGEHKAWRQWHAKEHEMKQCYSFNSKYIILFLTLVSYIRENIYWKMKTRRKEGTTSCCSVPASVNALGVAYFYFSCIQRFISPISHIHEPRYSVFISLVFIYIQCWCPQCWGLQSPYLSVSCFHFLIDMKIIENV